MAVDEGQMLLDLKMILREDAVPFFEDSELNFYLERNAWSLNAAARQCLLIKAEDTTISISGMNTADTSAYFRRMASMYRTSNSGILKGCC